MPKLKSSFDFGKIKTPEEFQRWASILLSEVGQAINGRLEFESNIKTELAEVTFTAGATDVSVSHALGKVPTGYIVVSNSADTRIYNGSASWTSSAIYLRASAATTIKVLIF